LRHLLRFPSRDFLGFSDFGRVGAARDLKKLWQDRPSSKNWDMTNGYNHRYSSRRDDFCSIALASGHMVPRYTVAKVPNPIDKHVGSRVRMRRMMLSMSQQKLADGLGLTFQQVQKYERGANRIGASRLQQISHLGENL
jgi:DNA-binding XRE family transcriptional regulator